MFPSCALLYGFTHAPPPQIIAEYQKALELSEEKVKLANDTASLLMRHKQRLDAEIKKFAAELEAATPGITAQAEQRMHCASCSCSQYMSCPIGRVLKPFAAVHT